MPSRACLTLTLFLLAASPGAWATDEALPPPSAATAAGEAPITGEAPVRGKSWMISAENPLAVRAGAAILAAGGSAVDAMVATQLVLGLVEPQHSGLGGGAFLLYWDAASGRLTTLDGRETAPSAATPKLFLDASGEPLSFYAAVVGGRSVGVPGTPRLLEAAHRRWGRKPWRDLARPAIDLARRGFAVSPLLARMIGEDKERLATDKVTADYFLPGGVPLAAGSILRNPLYAESLEALAREGAEAFYRGPLARAVVERVRGAANPGVLREQDLASYEVAERAPVCVAYRGRDICGMGPPSSGGVAIGQVLKMLEPFDLGRLGPSDPQSWRLIGDASRLAFADRERYLADSDFTPVPVKGLLADDYLSTRAELLRGDRALASVEAGSPAWDHAIRQADGEALELPSTTHIAIVDAGGNALSMTSTIEEAFGSRLMVGGYLLNNELTDFSFRTHKDGAPVANRVEPGKRPRSSMAPTIVLDKGRPVLVVGSPGGSRIIGYVLKTLIAYLDWEMSIEAAIALPNLVNRSGAFELEGGTPAAGMAASLEALGYKVEQKKLDSGLHGIAVTANGLEGGADRRREGLTLGE
jgi:gamma-glutamyltranspeptidase / glutathione hydrolase